MVQAIDISARFTRTVNLCLIRRKIPLIWSNFLPVIGRLIRTKVSAEFRTDWLCLAGSKIAARAATGSSLADYAE
jgi:hypothetical protein